MGNSTGQTLSLAFRPKRFSALVGLSPITKAICGQMASGRVPRAWMFHGDTGCGKTTLARIIAISLQCPHQKEFGEPCDDCISGRNQFDILEINSSDLSGADDMRAIAAGAQYAPRPPSRYRVFILDEAQKISDSGKNLLLKYFEDSPKTSVWIVCTTDPQKVLPALRGRCISYRIRQLSVDDVGVLVRLALSFAGRKKPAEPIVDALLEAGVFMPRSVLMAVEKYLAGMEPKAAASFEGGSEVDALRICRRVVEGNWKEVRAALKNMGADDSRLLCYSLAGYLKGVLLGGGNAKAAAEGIVRLSQSLYVDDGVRAAAVMAAVYDITRSFAARERSV